MIHKSPIVEELEQEIARLRAEVDRLTRERDAEHQALELMRAEADRQFDARAGMKSERDAAREESKWWEALAVESGRLAEERLAHRNHVQGELDAVLAALAEAVLLRIVEDCEHRPGSAAVQAALEKGKVEG